MYNINVIHKPDNGSIVQLKEIWMEAFHDSDDYVSFCLSNLPEEVPIIIAEEKGKIIGALYLFPFMIMPGNLPAYYEYAGAVRREFQGYSIYPEIIHAAQNYAKKQDAYSIGSAAEPHLIKPYKRLGFTEIYECFEEILECQKNTEDTQSLERQSLTISEWKHMRPHIDEGQFYMLPSDGWLKYRKEEKCYCKDIWEKVNIDGVWHTIIGDYEGDMLIIEETSASRIDILKNIDSLCHTYHISCLKVRFPITEENGLLNTVYNSQGTFKEGYLWTSLL